MIKLLVVDDHTMMREFLQEKLSKIPEVESCDSAEDGRQAIAKAEMIRPDVILMDISMPGLDGIETASMIRQKGLEAAILCLTMHIDMQLLQRALAVPVDGFLVKDDSFDTLVEAIKLACRGGRYLSKKLSFPDELLRHWETEPVREVAVQGQDQLTPRELEVIGLVASGLSKKEIATRLSISERTVDAHRQHIAQKTGLRRIAEVTRFAVRQKLISI